MAKREEYVEARRQRRRRQIFNGATKVFAQKGYSSATTQEIADAAGLAKGTLYEYVQSKEEILMLTVKEGLSLVKTETDKAIAGMEDPMDRLQAALRVQLNFAKKYRHAARVLRLEIFDLSENGRKFLSKIVDDHIEMFRAFIDDGIEKGRLKKLDSRIAAELLMHACSFYSDYGYLPHQKIPLNDITDFIIDNFVQGIVAE
ncbi:MAG TPA: TetR/AcrR family transcriptional regulator [bacterium]|nr:MAG: Fatty acid metabolism regulator protein [bacterium ADurb.Bin236]HOY63115.1 TetR/AcrR family transcriptional regulator [bacterium]HPI78435.1 TetR/AcrR family transcriptional regulator [bacterium]HPN93417.1 TetR/AcrR family transcriptional regulator [bacterium]